MNVYFYSSQLEEKTKSLPASYFSWPVTKSNSWELSTKQQTVNNPQQLAWGRLLTAV